MKKRLLIAVVSVVASLMTWAAPSSLPEYVPSVGRDFWFTYMDNGEQDNNDVQLRIYAVAEAATTVTVTTSGGVLTSSSVAAGEVFDYLIPSANRGDVYIQSSGVKANKGVHVTSTADIALYLMNNYEVGSRISYDGSPVLASGSLGKEYVVQTYYADKVTQQMAVVGTEDATEVTIVLGHAAINNLGPNFSAGQTLNITLNAGEVYQLKGAVDGDGATYLSGTTVMSSKPVAVFNAGVNTAVPWDDGADGDHIVEQSIPISSWGKRFIISEMHGFPGDVFQSEPTQFSLTAIYNDTKVSINGVEMFTLNRGETSSDLNGYSISVDYNEAPKFIETSKPVICYGYMTNGTSNKTAGATPMLRKNVGEPSMVLIPSVRQGVKTARFTTYPSGASTSTHYVNVIVPASATGSMKLNGSNVGSQFTTLSHHFSGQTTTWAFARLTVPAGYNVLSNDDAEFLSYAYGVQVGSARGYGYVTNFNLAPAAPEVYIDNNKMQHKQEIDFCNRHPGMPFTAVVDYVHDSVRWDYGDHQTRTFTAGDDYTDQHIYDILANGQSQTDTVNFYVFHHDPLSENKHTDTVTVYLNVHPTYYDTLVVDICGKDETYHWTHSSANFNNEHITKNFVAGNDALGVGALSHIYNFDKNTETEIFDSIVYKTQGHDCDSIFHLLLRVHREFTNTMSARVCQAEPYSWSGHPLNDHPAHRVWQKNNSTNVSVRVSGVGLSSLHTDVAGTFTVVDTMQSSLGCDSIWTLNFTVDPEYNDVVEGTTPLEACQAEPFDWTNHPVSHKLYQDGVRVTTAISTATAGTYTLMDSLQTIHGCDSVVTRQLIVHPEFNTVVEAGGIMEICQNEPFTWTNHPVSHKLYQNGVRVTTAISTATAGLFTLMDSLETIYGCDSVVTRQLRVHPEFNTVVEPGGTMYVCQGELFEWTGHPVSHKLYQGNVRVTTAISTATAGTYTLMDSLQTIHGCDSVVTRTLVVDPEYNNVVESATALDACQGEPFEWTGHPTGTHKVYVNGVRVTGAISTATAGTYTLMDSLVTVNSGCDSIVTRQLIVHPEFNTVVESATPLQICQGEPFTWTNHPTATHKVYVDGVRVTGAISTATAGTYTLMDSLETIYGCDSVVTRQLKVNPEYNNVVENATPLEACQNDAFTWTGHPTNTHKVYQNGVRVTTAISTATAGTFTLMDSLTTVNTGCDSIVTRQLIVHPVYEFNETHDICGGESYVWHGKTLTPAAGVHNYTNDNENQTSQYGCDSIYNLTLTVYPEYNSVVEAGGTMQICQGEPFEWTNHPVSTHKVYMDGVRVIGAISTATAGTYTLMDSLVTIHGCDSVVTRQFRVNPEYNNVVENATPLEACQNDAFTWTGHPTNTHKVYQNGVRVTTAISTATAGTFTLMDSLTTVNTGCDSIVTRQFIVHPVYDFQEAHTICEGETYNWHGKSLTPAAGVYNYTNDNEDQTSQYGCDSVYNLTLTVKTKTYATVDTVIGQGAAYTAADTKVYKGNKSTVTPFFESLAPSVTPYTRTATIANAAGCDSVITLHITVVEDKRDTIHRTICDNETVVFGGKTYKGDKSTAPGDVTVNAAGSPYFYSDTTHNYQGVPGKDSISVMELKVNLTYRIEEKDTICNTASLTWRGQSIPAGLSVGHHDYYDNLTSPVTGCDSIYHLDLLVQNALPQVTSATICYGESYDWKITHPCTGLEYTLVKSLTTSCELYDTIICPGAKCNQVYKLELTVRAKTPTIEETHMLCPNEEYDWRGLTITKAGVYETQDGADANGCPYNYRLTATQLLPESEEASDEICYGEPYTFNGTVYSSLTPGLHVLRDTILSHVGGCDSVYLTLRLRVGQDYLTEETVTACDSYFWRGHTYLQSGDYNDVLSSVNGCDSVYTLHLTINKSYHFTETYDIKPQQLPFTVHEFTYTAAGNYTRSYQTVAGCDSVYDITINVHALTITPDTLKQSICSGAVFTWRGNNYSAAGQYSTGLLPDDSTHVLVLNVKDSYRDTLRVHVCGSSYDWHGTRTASGTYVYNGTSALTGCDSVLVLDLKLAQASPITNINRTACAGELVAWGGQSFVAATNTVINHTLLNAAGCDSVVRLNLTVNNRTFAPADAATICSGEAYTWRGKQYSAPGTYRDTVMGGGCGTIYTLNLSVKQSYEFFQDIEIREEVLPYVWEGRPSAHPDTVIRTDGDYYDRFTSIDGCDSVYHLHFHIVPIPHPFVMRDTATVKACDTYTWNIHNRTHTYTESGLYSDTLWRGTAPQRYDTISFLDLRISTGYTFYEEEIVSCDNEFITWHCTTYNPSAGYYELHDTNTSLNGCDSVYHATFRVYKSFRDTLTDTMCQNDIYTWRGMTLSPAAGVHWFADTLTSLVTGCDSIFNLGLTVTPRTEPDTVEHTICNLAAYDWEGYHIADKPAGDHTYYKYYTPLGECETYHMLILHVYDVVPDTTVAAVCYGEPYDWWVDTDNNGSLDRHVQSGIYVEGYQYDTISDGAGCFKVFVLDLTVNDAPLYKDSAAVFCQGGSFTWNRSGRTYSVAGNYADTVASLLTGCDSIIYRLALAEQTSVVYNETVHRCYGETYTWMPNGTTYTASVEAQKVIPSLLTGCDSIVYNLSLVIDPAPLAGEESVVACADSYTWHGTVYTASGNYADVITSSLGCDSAVTLHLTLSHDEHFYETAVIKTTQLPYTWHEDTYTAAGTYTQAHQNIYGCDSTYHLTLVVNPLPSRQMSASICEGETYNWSVNGTPFGSYTAKGSYNHTTADSVFVLNLMVGKNYAFAENKTVCSSDLPYAWHGQALAAAGTYTDSHAALYGCDSTYTLTLNVNPTAATNAAMTLCKGEVFNWGPFFEMLDAGVYNRVATFHSLVSGCDSTVNLTLTVVGPTLVNAVTPVTVCDHELPYVWNVNGHTHTINAAGIYGDTVPSLLTGCDSILSSLNLTVNESFYEYDDVEIAEDAVPYIWNGHGMTLYNEGTYFDDQTSALTGCDSVYELHLHLNFYQRDTTWADGTHMSEKACDTYSWRGRIYTESVFDTDTTKNVNPVQIHYLSLVVNHSVYAAVEDVTACGSSYEWYGSRTASGTYNHTVAGAAENGCDSVYTLNLTLHPENNIAETQTICADEYLHWEDTLLHTAGTYTRRYTNIYGCDSLRTITLNVNPVYEMPLKKDTICEGESYTWTGRSLPVLTNLEPSNTPYIYYDHLTTGQGCDSVYKLSLLVQTPSVFRDTVRRIVCEKDTVVWERAGGAFLYPVPAVTESKEINVQCGDGVCVDSIYTLIIMMNPMGRDTVRDVICGNDTYPWAGEFLDAEGTYYDTLTSLVNGCDSVRVLILAHDPAPDYYPVTVVRCPGTVLNYSFAGQVFVYDTPGVYEDTVLSIHGCDSIYLQMDYQYADVTPQILEEYMRSSDLPYMIGTEIFSTPGTHNFTIQNGFGCDVPYTLNLHVLYDRFDTLLVHACASESKTVDFYGTPKVVYPVALPGVTLIDTLLVPTMADTVRHLTVIAENIAFQQDTTIYVLKNSANVTWPGHTLTKEGEDSPIPAAPTNITGAFNYFHRINCDSVYFMHLNVIDTPTTVLRDTVCPSELPYNWAGHAGKTVPVGVAEGAVTTLTDITSVSFGTPEVFNQFDTLYLFVKQSYNTVLPDTVVLQNDPLSFCGNAVSTAVPHTETLQTTLTSAVTGCDSVVSRKITVVRCVRQDLTACEGETLTWLGNDYSVTTRDTVVFPVEPLADTSDSVYVLNLVVKDSVMHAEENQHCSNGLSVTWRGKSYNATGIYRDTVFYNNDPDDCPKDIYTLNLVVGPLEVTNDTLCEGATRTWGTATATAPSMNNDFVRNDTLFRLNLYAAPTYDFVLDTAVYIGTGRPVVFNWQNEHGAVIRTFPTADPAADKFYGSVDSIYNTARFGCDSVYHITLRIYGDTLISELDTICADETLSWHCMYIGGRENLDTIVYDTLATWYGADSIHALYLHVGDSCLPKMAVVQEEVVCYGDTYGWTVQTSGGPVSVGTYSATGTYTFTDDSIYTLVFTVLDDYHFAPEYDTITAGADEQWQGIGLSLYGEGDHVINKQFLSVVGGCDSVFTLNLHVEPLHVEYVDYVEDTTICQGDFFDWYVRDAMVAPDGYHVSEEKTLTKVFNSLHFDTVYTYTMNVHVRSVEINNEFQQMPNGGTYIWTGHYGNIALTSDTVISDTVAYLTDAWRGCDSVIYVLNLTQLPPVTYRVIDTVFCQSETPILWGSEVLPVADLGLFHGELRTNPNMYGGDSVITINYTVVAAAQFDSVHVMSPLDAADYTWNGHAYHANMRDTTFVFYGTSMYGCDSVATLRAMTGLLSTDTAYATICPTEDSYHWVRGTLDTTFTEVPYGNNFFYGIKPTYLAGFDSVIVMSLTRLKTDTIHNFDTICYDPLLPDTLYEHFAGMSCDSVVKIRFVAPVYSNHYDVDTVTQGTDFVWGSQVINNIQPQGVVPGNPDFIFSNEPFLSQFGCDSVVTLWLYVAPVYEFPDTVHLCLGDSYTWDQTSLAYTPDHEGLFTYYKVYRTALDRDSVYSLTLNVELPYSNVQTVAVEQDETYPWRGRVLDATGYYYDSLTSIHGCDSVYGLQLYVGRISHDTVRATVCDGDAYLWEGQDRYTAGFHYHSLHFDGPPAFDSILVLELTVNPSYDYTTDMHWPQDSVFVWDEDGQTYDTHNVGLQMLSTNPQTALGCDSVLNLNLYVEPTWFIQEYDTVCSLDGMSLVNFDSIRTEHLTTAVYGFDSIVEHNLFVHGTPVVYEYDTVCHSGEEVKMWHGQNLHEIRSTVMREYEDGGFDLTGVDIHGGDTTLYATEKFRPGVYDCDTLFSLDLHVYPDYLFVFRDTIPDSEVYGTRWRDTLGVPELDSIQQVDPLETPQIFTFDDTLPTLYGCDSVYRLELLVGPTFKFEETLNSCDNDSVQWHDSVWYVLLPEGVYYDTLVYKTTLGYDSVYTLTLTVNPAKQYEWTDTICPTDSVLCGSRWITYTDTLGTDYENIVIDAWDTIQTYLGCDSVCHLTLRFYMQYDSLTVDSVCLNEAYYWQPTDSTYIYDRGGTYTDSVMLQTIHGCDSILRLELYVEDLNSPIERQEACLNDTLHWMRRDTLDVFIQAPDTAGLIMIIDSVYSALGCLYYDTLLLDVVNPVVVLSAEAQQFCADNNELLVNYTIQEDSLSGEPTVYYIYFSDEAVTAGFPASFEEQTMAHTSNPGTISVPVAFDRHYFPRPGTYEATLYLSNGSCRDTSTMTSVSFTFDVLYPSWFAEQHWNDLLAVLSPTANASDNNPEGYTFSAYQWYLNGAPVEGADGPMLYYTHGIPTLPSSDHHDPLPPGSYYQVLLTRADDGMAILTCPIEPAEVSDNDVHTDWYFTVDHTLIDRNEPNLNILTNTTGIYYLYDAAGKLLSEGPVPPYDEAGNQTPDIHNAYNIASINDVLYVPGTYLLWMISDNPSPYTGKQVKVAVKLLVH